MRSQCERPYLNNLLKNNIFIEQYILCHMGRFYRNGGIVAQQRLRKHSLGNE
jgi:hypothetical protein